MRRWLLTPLVASLFVLSFIESWAALLAAARAAGIPYPKPWPWMVDGFIVATALMVVEAARRQRRRGAWWPRLGLVGATALSTGIQATWAPPDEWAWALHAWSPLAVLFSFECLVWLLGVAQPAAPERTSDPAPARLRAWLRSWELPEASAPEVVRLDSKRPNSPTATRPNGFTPAQVALIDQRLAEQRSALSISKELGLSDRAYKTKLLPYVRAWAAPVGGPGPNGQGGGS